MANKKFYTVWSGREPGVYDNWEDCKSQVEGFTGAKYKSFPSEQEAKRAYNDSFNNFLSRKQKTAIENTNIIRESIAVDAACSGNPGKMEYQGVWTGDKTPLFHQGPFNYGTNNIGEFLALVHALALQKQKKTSYPIYSDSQNAIAWVRAGKCKTKLEETSINKDIFDMIRRAEKWLSENKITVRILKWDTPVWGEIPADFGRK